MRRAAALLVVLCALPASASAQFSYRPSGELVSGSGSGRADAMVYAPGILFPLESGPAFANSQVWGVGGSSGPSGSECDSRNFVYPWHDNYCETRSWSMPLCPSGTGHQGQDVRGPDCMGGVHRVLAVTDGMITNVGSYSVYLTAADGTRYDYLHMMPVVVSVGDTVHRGDLVGYLNNNFGGSSTTHHLHFNIHQSVSGVGSVYVPPYMSLIAAYTTLIGGGTVTPPPGPRFAATYVSQTFPLSSVPFPLAPGEPSSGYIELRNAGSETWRPSETFLATSNPRDASSALAGSDWVSPSRAATVDRVVAPGETGRFAFTLHAPATPGDYAQFFDPIEEGVAWFSDDGGPPDDQLEVLVTVVAGATYDAGPPPPPPPPDTDAGPVPPPPPPTDDAGSVLPGDDAALSADDAGTHRAHPARGGCCEVAGVRGDGTLAVLALFGLASVTGARRRRGGACVVSRSSRS